MDYHQEHDKMAKRENGTLRGYKGDAIDMIGGEQQATDKIIKQL